MNFLIYQYFNFYYEKFKQTLDKIRFIDEEEFLVIMLE